jgi:hypothetical protein
VKGDSASCHQQPSLERIKWIRLSNIFSFVVPKRSSEVWEEGILRYAKQANRLGVLSFLFLFFYNLPLDPVKGDLGGNLPIFVLC